MSAHLATSPPLPLPRLEEPGDIDDVLRGIGQVIDWSIQARSHIGYFACLYKRITLGIRQAIDDDVFDDGPRIGRLDVAFAHRYFDALNAYFHPDELSGVTLPWEVALVGDQDRQATMLQHMMAGLNAHISFDLGLAVLAVAADSLDGLADDYNRVNAVLCSQIPGIVKVVDRLSPELRLPRWLIPDEIRLFREMVRELRKGAWLFAVHMAMNPQDARQKIAHQEAWTAVLGSWYLQPTGRWGPLPRLVRAVARHESRDVAANIRALERVTHTPDPLDASYL